MQRFNGLEETQEVLVSLGYTLWPYSVGGRDNECDWIACKPIPAGNARCCETNGNKVQWVVHPFLKRYYEDTYETLEVEITGEYGVQWYQLKAYAISPRDVGNLLPTLEEKLLLAWNVLGPELEKEE